MLSAQQTKPDEPTFWGRLFLAAISVARQREPARRRADVSPRSVARSPRRRPADERRRRRAPASAPRQLTAAAAAPAETTRPEDDSNVNTRQYLFKWHFRHKCMYKAPHSWLLWRFHGKECTQLLLTYSCDKIIGNALYTNSTIRNIIIMQYAANIE